MWQELQDFATDESQIILARIYAIGVIEESEGRTNEGVTDVVQQLTIFDAVPKKEAFDVGDTVEW